MTGRLMDWLADEAKGLKEIAGYIVLTAFIVISLREVIYAALVNWGLRETGSFPESGLYPFAYYNFMDYIDTVLLHPLMEELIFRVVPLTIVIAIVSRSPKFVFGATALFAILFGAIHPYDLTGNIQVAIYGFFFGIVFLKCGGLNKNFLKAAIAAVAAHGTTNLFTILYAWWEYFQYTM